MSIRRTIRVWIRLEFFLWMECCYEAGINPQRKSLLKSWKICGAYVLLLRKLEGKVGMCRIYGSLMFSLWNFKGFSMSSVWKLIWKLLLIQICTTYVNNIDSNFDLVFRPTIWGLNVTALKSQANRSIQQALWFCKLHFLTGMTNL